MRALNKKGVTGMVIGVVTVVIAFVLFSAVVLPTIFTANQTGWSTSTVSVWNALGPISVVLLMLIVVIVLVGGRQ